MNRALSIVNLVALVVTVVINYLSNTVFFNGATVGSISDQFETLITPAPYAFGIWAVIYLGLAAFVISHLSTSVNSSAEVNRVGIWFLLSCLANCCWILAWVHGYIGWSVVIMLLLVFSLVKIIIRTDMELTDPGPSTIVFLWWPFCLYFGWICIASLVNIAAWLVSIHWNGLGMNASFRAISMIIVAAMIYLLLTWRRNMREAALVGVWAFIAIGVADRAYAPSVAIAAWIMAVIVFLSSMLHAYKNRKLGPFRRRT